MRHDATALSLIPCPSSDSEKSHQLVNFKERVGVLTIT